MSVSPLGRAIGVGVAALDLPAMEYDSSLMQRPRGPKSVPSHGEVNVSVLITLRSPS